MTSSSYLKPGQKQYQSFTSCTTCTWCGMQIDTLLITYSFNVQMGMYFHSHKFVIGQQQVFFLKVIWIWMQRFFNLNWQLKVDHGKEGKCQVIWLSMYRVWNGHVTCSSKRFHLPSDTNSAQVKTMGTSRWSHPT